MPLHVTAEFRSILLQNVQRPPDGTNVGAIEGTAQVHRTGDTTNVHRILAWKTEESKSCGIHLHKENIILHLCYMNTAESMSRIQLARDRILHGNVKR